MFERKGVVVVPADQTDEESLMDLALDAGADDVSRSGDAFQVTCPVDAFNNLSAAIESAEGLSPESQSIGYVPNDTVLISGDDARKAVALLEALDDHDDVQQVAANFEVDEATLAEMNAG